MKLLGKRKEVMLLSASNEVVVGRHKVKISPKEAGVLELLMNKNDSTVCRTEILTTVWGDKYANDQGLTQAISRLRKILGNTSVFSIRTIPKKGYLLQTKPVKKFKARTLKINLNIALIVILLVFLGSMFFIKRIEIRIDKFDPDTKGAVLSES